MLLWGDRVSREEAARHPQAARFPYLGRDFELIERKAGAAPGLGNIHCFNWGVTFSHGAMAGDIPGVAEGVNRLSHALSSSLFVAGAATVLPALAAHDDRELERPAISLPRWASSPIPTEERGGENPPLTEWACLLRLATASPHFFHGRNSMNVKKGVLALPAAAAAFLPPAGRPSFAVIEGEGRMTRIGLGLVALFLWPSLALADKLLSGEDAAYIDWSVNNCGTKSTDKEHAMVDQANANGAGVGSCEIS